MFLILPNIRVRILYLFQNISSFVPKFFENSTSHPLQAMLSISYTGNLYKAVPRFGEIFFLLLLTSTASTCLQHYRNLGTAL